MRPESFCHRITHILGYFLGYRTLRKTLGWAGYLVARGLGGSGLSAKSPLETLANLATLGIRDRFLPQPAVPVTWQGAIWAHCASLGEAAGMLRLLKGLGFPMPLVLTAQTEAGLKRLNGDAQAYLSSPWLATWAPFESTDAVERFISTYRIVALVIYESEWWPAYLETARRRKLPLLWLAAQCTSTTLRRWSRVRATAHYLLSHFDFIQARSREAARRLGHLTDRPVSVGFDAKGLGFAFAVAKAPPLSTQRAVAFYCLHADEWPLLVSEMPELMQAGPVFILPRKTGDFAFFRRVLQPLGFSLWSEGCEGREGDKAPKNHTGHWLVDTLGQASVFLAQAQVAFVGGTLSRRGGHAFFEPLSHGLHIFAGPSLHQQEPMARDLRKAGLLTLWRPGGKKLAETIAQQCPQIETGLFPHRERIRSFFEARNRDWDLALHAARQALLSLVPR